MSQVIQLRPVLPSEPWMPHTDGRGSFCERHFSWLCGCGQGRCQEEFFAVLVKIGWR